MIEIFKTMEGKVLEQIDTVEKECWISMTNPTPQEVHQIASICGVEEDVLYPSAELNQTVLRAAEECNLPVHLCRVHSSDVFYHENNVADYHTFYREHQCKCVEMESFALFHNAIVLGKQAACLLTISDSFINHKVLSAQDRETSFDAMMQVALETAILPCEVK